MRKSLKIPSRVSAITNAFVQAVIPSIEPSDDERNQVLEIFGQEKEASILECVYCGDKASDWDHLKPLVKNKKPSGYINEIRNLVPSCGACNQSKSGREWHEWILSNAKLSPASRGIAHIDLRISRLKAFEEWAKTEKIDLEKHVDRELWESYWKCLSNIEELMRDAQVKAIDVQAQIKKSMTKIRDGNE